MLSEPIFNVAEPGCISGIPDPDFFPTRIADLGSRVQQQEKTGGEKISSLTFFCSNEFHKIEHYFNFLNGKEKTV